MPDTVSNVKETPEPWNKNPVLIVGISAAIIVITVGLTVIFKPEWLGGKSVNSNQYVLTSGNTSENPQIENSKPTPVPIPTPNTGPGPWACDPQGVCNRYDESSKNKGCPKTFADTSCLNQCGNTTVRCAKF